MWSRAPTTEKRARPSLLVWWNQTITRVFEGVTLLWAFDPDAVPVGEQIEATVRLLIEGVRVER